MSSGLLATSCLRLVYSEPGSIILTISKEIFGAVTDRETWEESTYLVAEVSPARAVLDPTKRANRTFKGGLGPLFGEEDEAKNSGGPYWLPVRRRE